MAQNEPNGFFSSVVREARAMQDVSQSEFARLCGVKQPTIVKWERGNNIAEATLVKVARALNIPIEALLFPRVAKGYRDYMRRKKEANHGSRAP